MSEILRKGTLVYELDEDGVNRWSFDVQPGIGLDGFRQPDSVIERVAKNMQTRYSYHDRLVEALRELAESCANLEIEAGRVDKQKQNAEDLLEELEQQK